jgi:hypothetical protein
MEIPNNITADTNGGAAQLLNGGDKHPHVIELDEVTKQFLDELRQQCDVKQREAAQQAALPFINQQQAALQIFMRRNNLDGNWKLRLDGSALIREE